MSSIQSPNSFIVVSFFVPVAMQQYHGWQLCFPLQLHAGGSDFRVYDGFDLKTYKPSIMKRQYDICYSNKCQICLSYKLLSPQAFLTHTVNSW